MTPRLLFFYGTLMKGEGRSSAPEGLGARLVGPGKIRGDLYSVGDSFPAYMTGGGEIVGEVWEVPDDETMAIVLHTTDTIEGYHPGRDGSTDHCMYVREEVALLDDPEGRRVLTYRWNRGLDRWITPIPSGSWREHIEPIKAAERVSRPGWFDEPEFVAEGPEEEIEDVDLDDLDLSWFGDEKPDAILRGADGSLTIIDFKTEADR